MNAKLEHSLIKHGSVWVVLRGFDNIDGPEVDVFVTEEAAREHYQRAMVDREDGYAVIREEVVMVDSYLDEDGE